MTFARTFMRGHGEFSSPIPFTRPSMGNNGVHGAMAKAVDRERVAAFNDLAEENGATVTFDYTNGGHRVAIFRIGRRSRKVFFSATPSDGRALQNSICDARRALYILTRAP